MKILYIHQYFVTPEGHGGSRCYEFARRWVAAGHQVHVLTTNSYDPTLPRRGSIELKGIHIRCLGGVYRNRMGFLGRIIAFLRFAVQSSWLAARAGKFDVVVASSTPLTVAFPALSAKWLARRPLVFEVRDIWPEGAIQAGFLKNRFLIALARLLEKTVYKNADHIVALSSGMQDEIENKGIPAEKISMLPNCADLESFYPDSHTRDHMRKETNAESKFVILYAGALGLANDIPFIAQAIDRMKAEKDIQWWFAGGGSQFNYLRQQQAQYGKDKVVLWGEQPRSRVARFIQAADTGIVSFINQPVYYQNSPNKFFDYSAGGLPSIFTRTTWLEPLLKQYQAGFVCRQNTVDEFIEAIQQLRANPRLREEIGGNARKLAEEYFSRDRIASQYLALLKTKSGSDNVQ